MLRAIIFDFDGTIADTVAAIREGVNLTMEKHGFPTHSHEAVRSFINNGARELIRAALPEHLQQDDATLDRVLADYDALYATTYHHTDRAYDGIPELIAKWHNAGLKIGVLSNKQDRFVALLSKQVLLPDSFDATQGAVAGKPTKPNPYLSERIAAALGVSTSECIMVGDSHVDIHTATAAGMRHVGVSWGYRSEELLRANGADLVARTPAELDDILNDLIKKGI